MTIRSYFNPLQQRQEYETVPEVIPSTLQQIVATDAHLLVLHLVGSSSDATVSVADGNGLAIVPPNMAVDLTTGDYLRFFDGRLCPGGITWQSSDGATVVGYARWFV